MKYTSENKSFKQEDRYNPELKAKIIFCTVIFKLNITFNNCECYSHLFISLSVVESVTDDEYHY